MNIRELCLGTLHFCDASGYEIKKMFEDSFCHFQNVSIASIYPALAKLEAEGLVRHRIERQEKRPDKKVFSLTARGREAFLDNLSTLRPDEQYRSDFLVLLMFAHLLATETLEALVREQLGNIEAEIRELERASREETLTSGMRFGLDYGLAVKQAKIDFIKTNLKHLLREHRREARHENKA